MLSRYAGFLRTLWQENGRTFPSVNAPKCLHYSGGLDEGQATRKVLNMFRACLFLHAEMRVPKDVASGSVTMLGPYYGEIPRPQALQNTLVALVTIYHAVDTDGTRPTDNAAR